jgi:uncharacterized membrane-anchored protein
MKMPSRTRHVIAPPGLVGTARVDRRIPALLARLRPGDIAVLDHLDLDRATAQALVDAEVAAVINAAACISGRYPPLGPEVLTTAGVLILDRADAALQIKDGARVRIHEDVVYAGEEPVAHGRELDGDGVRRQLEQAREQMVVQLETLTHNSTEFLRREQDLLLHGRGLPGVGVAIEGRPVVVVVDGADVVAELRAIRRFVAEQRPVLVGVDRGADALVAAGLTPDIVVVDAHGEDRNRAKGAVLKSAREVVVRLERGAPMPVETFERMGVRPLRLETSATAEDAALLLAHAQGASVIVGVGLHATITDFLDRQRAGLASTYLTRLTVGDLLVDASAVPTLYSGRVRPRHVFLVLLLGLIALAVAVSVTPVGQDWADAAITWVGDRWREATR